MTKRSLQICSRKSSESAFVNCRMPGVSSRQKASSPGLTKKPRGRPPKAKDEASLDDETLAENSTERQPLKTSELGSRKRGRPTSAAPGSNGENEVPSSGKKVGTKSAPKKRGRQPKTDGRVAAGGDEKAEDDEKKEPIKARPAPEEPKDGKDQQVQAEESREDDDKEESSGEEGEESEDSDDGRENKKPKKRKSALAIRAQAYQEIKRRNIEERNRKLRELGLLEDKQDLDKIRSELAESRARQNAERRREIAEKRRATAAARAEAFKNRPPEEKEEEQSGGLRRSARVRKQPATYQDLWDDDEDGAAPKRRRYDDSDDGYDVPAGRIDHSRYKYKKPPAGIPRPQIFGAIPGVPVGESFESREEANWANIHRPTVAGISGNDALGCYSVCMNGGYEDDVDYGNCFTYTGSGGRDLKGTKAKPKNLRTAPQSKNQELTGMNLALAVSCDLKKPVRVMRGYKLKSDYAPDRGYRYDGLYVVEKYYQTQGLSGFQVYCFIFKRMDNQDHPPWVAQPNPEKEEDKPDEKEAEDPQEEKEGPKDDE